MKFTVKGLIALFLTSSALVLTPMRSDAQVNMKSLAEVAKSCQKDVFSFDYYKQMGFDTNVINRFPNNEALQRNSLLGCIESRYHYSLILDKFPELASTGEILPGYPSSVAIGKLARIHGYPHQLLDCLVTQDASSQECSTTKNSISTGYKIRNADPYYYHDLQYIVYVCPSCIVAHDEVSGSGEIILKSFIEWFLKLDKPQRREVFSLLENADKAGRLRWLLYKESGQAVQEYQETRARVERQEKERRKRELLGN